MPTPSRLLTSKLLRRAPPLLLSSFAPNTFLHSLLPSSTRPYHHHRHHDHYNRRSSISNSVSRHYCLSFSRRYSTHPDLSESEEPFYPVRVLIALFDSYHDFTGFPWWIIISSSTVAMRLALFPIVILQLRKLKRIGELLPKLPPPFPPPLSGRSLGDQISLFFKEKHASGCPSMFWFFASFVVQVPCFFLWIMSVRKMSLDHHPGFDCGGTLWFQNLTEYPHSALGPVVPLFIAGLHFTNVQISFQKASLQQLGGSLGLLAKWYKIYLQLLTLPIMFAAFSVPQGSLVYWLTNSSLTLIQQLSLSHPDVLEYLGLPKKNAPAVAPTDKGRGNSAVADILILTKQGEISSQSLSPKELISFSIKVLSDGRKDTAIKLLRLALVKDPGCVRALLIMGQTLLQEKQFVAATECLESAISKFCP